MTHGLERIANYGDHLLFSFFISGIIWFVVGIGALFVGCFVDIDKEVIISMSCLGVAGVKLSMVLFFLLTFY